VGGKPVTFKSPRDALNLGIATVYQDLALIPSMPIYRNFFLGCEPEVGWGPLRRMDKKRARATASAEIEKIGVDVGDIERAVMTLSGVSVKPLQSPGRYTLAQRFSSSMSPLHRLASRRPQSFSDASIAQGSTTSVSSSDS
jgi:hypothetical protein